MKQYTLDDLFYLMQRLRDPADGCPWDREQDFASIAPHTIEESYELADAIESGDMQQIREELGDVLFQVVFYTQLGRELGQFDLGDIVQSLVTKLLRRHPHVFPDGLLRGRVASQTAETGDVKRQWEQIKAQERRQKQHPGVLDDIPIALPALTRAVKLQKRAARVGFDWNHPQQVLAHVFSEIEELNEARSLDDPDRIEEEFGDVLFCMINLARHWKIDPETSLRRANRKFETRFRYVEQELGEEGLTPGEASLGKMDSLWEEAKTKGL